MAEESAPGLRVVGGDGGGGKVRVKSFWEGQLTTTPRGAIEKTAENGACILANSGDWDVRFDELARSAVVMEGPSLNGIPAPRWGTYDDYHTNCIKYWLNASRWGLKLSARDVDDAVRFAAKMKGYNPLSQYLKGLDWDGVPRIGTWLSAYLGAEDAPVTREIGRMWLVSAAARGLRPGSKADSMLVLEGKQGARKTSALEVLVGDEWFQDSLPDLRNKDAQVLLLGKWVVCMDELHALRSADVTELAKNYLTRRVDKYRPPYEAKSVSVPRSCVFAGTTNADQYLTDPTGNRRFWPVRVGKVDIEALARDRDQLWAEAVSEYMDGRQWWPDDKTAELIDELNTERTQHDEWHWKIERFASDRQSVRIGEILHELGFERAADFSQADQNRVAKVLRQLGWRRVRGSRDTAGNRPWCYVRKEEA